MKKKTSKPCDEDIDLMRRASWGDLTAFEALYRKYCHALSSYLAALDGHHSSLDDLIQEVFVRAWHSRQRFRGRSTFKTYLFGIARNVLHEEHRRLCKDRVRRQKFIEHSIQSTDTRASDDLCRDELVLAVQEALKRLTFKQRKAIQLFHIEGKSLREAAVLAGCTIEAFQKRLLHGRRRLLDVFKSLQDAAS